MIKKGFSSIEKKKSYLSYKTRLIVALIGGAFGIVFMFIKRDDCEDELSRALETYRFIGVEDEIHGVVRDIRNVFCFQRGNDFTGVVDTTSCMIDYRLEGDNDFLLMIGDSITKQPNSNVMIVFREKRKIICEIF